MVADNDSDDDLPLSMVVAKKITADEKMDQTSNLSFPEVQKDEDVEPLKKPVHDLFEYEWPKKRSGDFYIIEEELLQFLGINEVKGGKK